LAIFITGSVAYDRIMNFPGKFMDAILPDQIHNLNVSFFIDRLEEKLGGNAGNIAYSLNLLEEKPLIVATVGRDFERYRDILEKRGLSLEAVRCLEEDLTAAAYIITDQSNNQITGFHAAAMMSPSLYKFPALDPDRDMAIICPSNPEDMNAHPLLYKKKGIRYIYDPAQQIPILSPADLRERIDGAYLLVGNDYEISLIMKMTGLGREELVNCTRRGLVITLGEKGSLVLEKGRAEEAVSSVPVQNVADPTGAGDAFRAGLIKGLLLGRPLAECARLGSTCAAYCIERHGTQEHHFRLDEFFRRHEAAFGVAGQAASASGCSLRR
jgi:adenosine kinase